MGGGRRKKKKKRKREDYISVDYINAECITACGQALILLPSSSAACEPGSPGQPVPPAPTPRGWAPGKTLRSCKPPPSLLSHSSVPVTECVLEPVGLGVPGCPWGGLGAGSPLYLPRELRQSRARSLSAAFPLFLLAQPHLQQPGLGGARFTTSITCSSSSPEVIKTPPGLPKKGCGTQTSLPRAEPTPPASGCGPGVTPKAE